MLIDFGEKREVIKVKLPQKIKPQPLFDFGGDVAVRLMGEPKEEVPTLDGKKLHRLDIAAGEILAYYSKAFDIDMDDELSVHKLYCYISHCSDDRNWGIYGEYNSSWTYREYPIEPKPYVYYPKEAYANALMILWEALKDGPYGSRTLPY